jgi:hypothetical protein
MVIAKSLFFFVRAPDLTSICEMRPLNELRYLKTLRYNKL